MLIIGIIAPNGFEFVFLQIITGMIAIFSLASVRRRNQLFFSAFLIFCTYSLVYFCMSIIYNGGLVNIEWSHYIWFLANCLLLLMSYPLIYIFERIFGFLSDVTLLELADTNRSLLRSLEEKAPGTFQHSLQVANLCEETIYKIGGDPLLVRAGALYHDIGKMDIPYFFIENQVLGFNPHDEIDFEKSAEIIISHVEHGVKIAKKHGIPEPIIDFIRTHHGNSKVQYFYKSFIKKYPESEVEIDKFTYPGPCPFSKETSVLMMADSVEAASRSLKVIDEKTISDLVEEIINYQINENQHADANLTFKDVSTIKKILKKKLKNIYHERIQYPG
jgi:cyclic-di-AMP phosphodiesterase PgpH